MGRDVNEAVLLTGVSDHESVTVGSDPPMQLPVTQVKSRRLSKRAGTSLKPGAAILGKLMFHDPPIAT